MYSVIKRRMGMKINIVTDSGADFTPAELKELAITMLPLKVSFEDGDYLDGVNLFPAEFYKKLNASPKLPKTSQICPFEFEEVFEEIKKKGEQAIVVTLSSSLSGCFQSACIAAENYEGIIRVVDSKTVSLGEQIVIKHAIGLIDEGRSLDDIADTLTEDVKRLKTVAMLDTLTNLKKGGRISATKCIAGNLLSLKPLVEVIDGAVEFLGAARGRKKGFAKLNEAVENSGPVDTSLPRAVASNCSDGTVLKEYLAASTDTFGEDIINYFSVMIGPAIGTHVGPDAVAAAFFAKK